jgi:hypothetical protein
MQMFEYTDFIQNLSKVFDMALVDEVIINNKDGNSYKLLPIKNKTEWKSPFEDIPCINANITTQEIVEILRESRAGI